MHQLYHITKQTACWVHRQASQEGKTGLVHCGSDLYLCNGHLPVVFWTCDNVDRAPAAVLTNLGNTQTPLRNSFGCCTTVISRWKERCVQSRCTLWYLSCVLQDSAWWVEPDRKLPVLLSIWTGRNSTETVIHTVGQKVNSFLKTDRRFLDLATTLLWWYQNFRIN